MPGWLEIAAGVCVAVTSVLALVKALGLDKLTRGVRGFLEDWQGEPERPGRARRPSFPERMTSVETRVSEVGEAVLVSQEQARANHAELVTINERVTEHRRRNDDQILLLREAVDETNRRLNALVTRRRNHPPESSP